MSSVITERDDAVAVITVNRAEVLNSLDDPCRRLLLRALVDASADREVRAIVVTGAGRAFCAGQDVTASEELVDAGATVWETYNPIVAAIRATQKPVFAAINGLAVGAGMGIALACDIRTMDPNAYFACAFGKVGLVPDSGVTVSLLRGLGHAHAFEAAVSGRRIGAEEALAARLVNEVCEPGESLERAVARARRLAAGPEPAIGLTKRLFVAASRGHELELLELEARYQGIAAESRDHRRAVEEFQARSAARER